MLKFTVKTSVYLLLHVSVHMDHLQGQKNFGIIEMHGATTTKQILVLRMITTMNSFLFA
jgi:hypothetical protein